jgi:histidine triad (HIT) family protein
MHSHAPAEYLCPFCNYVAGGGDERVGPEHVVERTDATITYVSPKWWPKNPGNLLVIPTEHWESLYSLPDYLGLPILRATRRAARALKAAYGCDGVSTRQHNEPAGNQDVWHYHVHVFPRWVGDDLYGSRGAWADRAEMTGRAERLRAAYAQMAV